MNGLNLQISDGRIRSFAAFTGATSFSLPFKGQIEQQWIIIIITNYNHTLLGSFLFT